ncbi:glycoside hydrolase [Chitinophaga silvatica]|uniref:Glycoside hydrolase n=1 Tax=Chitinophaga silvatica TaxID=2282649 RepID=A0A3E1YG63_9BACT|nr:glycoside hydrolase family 9 protein [Chitinophaga silvatica]RFS26368.1 glycoside hydrolase [Chitinophaga silvatica]
MKYNVKYLYLLTFLMLITAVAAAQQMKLNSKEYLEYQGVNVMLAHDFYPEGHQGGVGIIQHGQRIATNGDLRLEPTPGQWSPIPKVGKRMVDKAKQIVSVRMVYPDSAIDRKGFNPITYPDLHFAYTISMQPAGKGVRVIVDLEKPLPDEWIGKVGFNFELFPGALFGKSFAMDQQVGIFPQQSSDQVFRNHENELEVKPIATGKQLTIVPESDYQRMSIESIQGDALQLLDGRALHSNGWYVVRSLIKKGATKNAIEWIITPNAIANWQSPPVVQLSQVGYHSLQEKKAIIELDANDKRRPAARLLRITSTGPQAVLTAAPEDWGTFLRYHYLRFDFSKIKRPGMYMVQYGDVKTSPFAINDSIYQENVWQPTLAYFLPAQMCHVRVNDKYRVWHGACHLDDARMAPVDSNHFDGYLQGHSTLTSYKSGATVPQLNRGGWHDAGDYDLRVESQAETIHGLTLAYENFGLNYDNTTIDQLNRVVEIQQPDGKADALQQIEHGLLSVVDGYRALGRFYRGIIEPTLRQYVLLGDPVNLTDNVDFNSIHQPGRVPVVGLPGSADDRWVFTEENPGRALEAAVALAAASRVMKGYNDTLARQSLQIAKEVWQTYSEKYPARSISLAVELLITTGDHQYESFLISQQQNISQQFSRIGWVVSRALPLIKNADFKAAMTTAAKQLYATIEADGHKTPYGVPYEPNIWGAGWGIQNFGYRQFFLHQAFPEIISDKYLLNALNFILGCHPGANTASFVSGVGASSMTTAYGFNRADWSYIPGGVASGTALIRPDFPELMKWPYFWQQGEYVLGGGTTDYLFLVLAANKLLNEKK